VTGWSVILEGATDNRPPTVLDGVPSAFVAVPHIGDIIEGSEARYIVTCVAHCEETPEIPAHVRKQLEGIAAPSSAAAQPVGMKVESTAMAVVARAQLKPRPLCKIYVVRGGPSL